MKLTPGRTNILFFAGGFVLDLLTVGPIDSWIDIGLSGFYLLVLSMVLVLQRREETGSWSPPSGWLARGWRHNVEAMHFLYGALLSMQVVLYFRSTTGARPVIFLVLLGLVMLLNELPPVRQLGCRMRLGLYAFSLATFTIYLVPLLFGRLGDLVFGASIALAGCLFMGTVMAMGDGSKQSRRERTRLAAPGIVVCLALGALYLGGLIPPVPLSVQAHGLYYDVRKEADTYTLRTLPPRPYVFWRSDSRPFRARSGDSMVYFARVFAPAGFSHRVIIHWELFDESAGKYTTTDRIPMTVVGGRSLGFRGFAMKSSVQPGRWRVGCETEDGRSISVLTFRVIADAGTDERRFREIRM